MSNTIVNTPAVMAACFQIMYPTPYCPPPPPPPPAWLAQMLERFINILSNNENVIKLLIVKTLK